MPRPSLPEELTRGPFRGSAAIASSLLTRRQLQGRCWTRLLRDVYIWSEIAIDSLTLIAAAALVLPPEAVFSGLTAAWLHGARATPIQTVEASIPPSSHARGQPGLVLRRSVVPAEQRQSIGGFVFTSAARTAADLARWLPLVDAVVHVEQMLRVSAMKLDEIVAVARAGPGSAKLRRVLGLVNPLAESPMETRLRLLLVQAGLACPTVQQVVLDAFGRFVARVDLAYPDLMVAIEYDGDHHRDRATMIRDAQRQNELVQLGWTVLRFTATDVYRHPDRVVAQVRHAIEASSRAR